MIHVDDRVQTLAAAAADPQRASRYLEEFEHRHPALLKELLQDPNRAHWLVTVFSFSHFLSEELLRRPEWLFSVADVYRPLSTADYSQRLYEFVKRRGGLTDPRAPLSAFDLALFRRKELLRIVIRDALELAPLAELTEELSNLADAILDAALVSVIHDVEARHGTPITTDASGQPVPAVFAVIALGKLGGRELNYSSDIDLMFLYSGNGETSGPQKSPTRNFSKKSPINIRVCFPPTRRRGCVIGWICASGLRAAWVMSASRWQPPKNITQNARAWELQMLIKARVAAGDRGIGQELLDFVEPLIYSTTLDFSLIESMSATRERIGEKLARKRTRKDELNVKLAPGGIRDIEFLVQCLQRLHGGRESWVRHGGTLLALSRLLDRDLLSANEYSRLTAAYRFLRCLEHRLQFEDDRQTHSLPSY